MLYALPNIPSIPLYAYSSSCAATEFPKSGSACSHSLFTFSMTFTRKNGSSLTGLSFSRFTTTFFAAPCSATRFKLSAVRSRSGFESFAAGMFVRTLGEPITVATSIHSLLNAMARSRSAPSAAYGLCSPSAAMFTIAPPACATAARTSSRYALSSERKCSLHGSIFLILNLLLTCAANSFSSIFPPPAFRAGPPLVPPALSF